MTGVRWAIVAWLLAMQMPMPARSAVPPPNFLVVLTDDQRWDSLGCAGNRIARTPHLDRLASRGVRFENAFCTTSICAISRASILTGQFARRHGIVDFTTPLSSTAWSKTFPAILRKAGYRTGFVGKWGLGDPLPADQYDDWKGFSGQGSYFAPDREEHLEDILCRHATQFIEACPADRPFLLQLSTKASHCQDGDNQWPFQPARRYNELFKDVTFPKPATATEQAFEKLPLFLQQSEGRARWQVRFANEPLYQKSVADYYRLVTGIDDTLGKLVEAIERKGVADRTVILFLSDNGFFLGEHGLAGKWTMHEESIRIPFLLVDPRRSMEPHGRVSSATVLNIDVAPTILRLADLDVPSEMQGASLDGIVHGEQTTPRVEFFYEHLFAHPKIPKCEGVRTRRWKYIRYIETDPTHESLFDLSKDPRETNDLAVDAQYATVLGQLRDRWRVLREEAR